MLSESNQYDHAVNVIYETLTHPRGWHAVCAAIAGLIGARAVWITVSDKRLAKLPSGSFGYPENKDYLTAPEDIPGIAHDPIESFARFESDQKSTDFGHISAP